MKHYNSIKLFALLVIGAPSPLSSETTIDYPTAVEKAFYSSPALAAKEADVGIESAVRWQDSFSPNPEFRVELNGDNPPITSNGDEVTYSITQRVETGGKRWARISRGNRRIELALWDLEVYRISIEKNVAFAMIDAAAAQETLKILSEQMDLSNQVLDAVENKIKAGKAGPPQRAKASITKAHTILSHDKARRNLVVLKQVLAQQWGSSCIDFETVSYPYYQISPLPEWEEIYAKIAQTPEAFRWYAALEEARHSILVERTRALPDITLEAGYNTIQDSHGTVLLGLCIPIPLCDRNQGNIAKASREYYQIQTLQEQNRIERENLLLDAYSRWQNAFLTVNTLKNDILPAAQKAFEASQEGYSQGKYEYLDVLDSQRTFFETQEQYIVALADYHMAKALVHQMTTFSSMECSHDE